MGEAMRIFSRATLQAFWKTHPDSEPLLRAWFHEVDQAAWTGPAEVRARFGGADFIGSDRVIFSIRGNRYRLVALVRYAPFCCVYVRFVGTHAQYDAIDVTTV